METALLAVDGAVLVVSAVEGVQAQTAVIGRVLSSLKIPIIIFINKTERAGADIRRVLHELYAIVSCPVLMEQPDDVLADELSRGRGAWRTQFDGYYPAPPGVGQPIPRTTPDPMNSALYIDFITGRTKLI